MKIGIYSSLYAGLVKDTSIDYIGADNGLIHLLNQNIKPIFVIGDFDSLKNQQLLDGLNIKKYPAIKDDTDTELAIKEAIQKGYNEIDLYGVTGKRIDHFMAVLCLLKKYSHINITIYDEYNKIYLLKKGIHDIYKDDYKYLSLFSYKPTFITLKDCHYPLSSYLLESDNPLCVSNQINKEKAYIEISEDILIIQSK
jgi:thiamine pyrophosphokinase